MRTFLGLMVATMLFATVADQAEARGFKLFKNRGNSGCCEPASCAAPVKCCEPVSCAAPVKCCPPSCSAPGHHGHHGHHDADVKHKEDAPKPAAKAPAAPKPAAKAAVKAPVKAPAAK